MKLLFLCVPSGVNTGMKIVDEAIHPFVDELNKFVEVEFEIASIKAMKGYKPYSCDIFSDAYDAIVYWGDFQLSSEWRREIAPQFVHEDWEGYYGKQLKTKKLFLGVTCMPDSLSGLMETVSMLDLENTLIGWRDCISYGKCLLVEPSCQSRLSFDNAFFHSLSREVSTQALGCGVFFYRNLTKKIHTITRAIPYLLLALKFRREVHWLEWFPARGFGPHIFFRKRTEISDARSALQAIERFEHIVTDTYHVGVTALALGKQVTMLGAKSTEFESTVSSFKKPVLASQLGVGASFVELNRPKDYVKVFLRNPRSLESTQGVRELMEVRCVGEVAFLHSWIDS